LRHVLIIHEDTTYLYLDFQSQMWSSYWTLKSILPSISDKPTE